MASDGLHLIASLLLYSSKNSTPTENPTCPLEHRHRDLARYELEQLIPVRENLSRSRQAKSGKLPEEGHTLGSMIPFEDKCAALSTFGYLLFQRLSLSLSR